MLDLHSVGIFPRMKFTGWQRRPAASTHEFVTGHPDRLLWPASRVASSLAKSANPPSPTHPSFTSNRFLASQPTRICCATGGGVCGGAVQAVPVGGGARGGDASAGRVQDAPGRVARGARRQPYQPPRRPRPRLLRLLHPGEGCTLHRLCVSRAHTSLSLFF